MLHKWGATGLLVEYEDMFPYTGDLADLSATNAYRSFISLCLSVCLLGSFVVIVIVTITITPSPVPQIFLRIIVALEQ